MNNNLHLYEVEALALAQARFSEEVSRTAFVQGYLLGQATASIDALHVSPNPGAAEGRAAHMTIPVAIPETTADGAPVGLVVPAATPPAPAPSTPAPSAPRPGTWLPLRPEPGTPYNTPWVILDGNRLVYAIWRAPSDEYPQGMFEDTSGYRLSLEGIDPEGKRFARIGSPMGLRNTINTDEMHGRFVMYNPAARALYLREFDKSTPELAWTEADTKDAIVVGRLPDFVRGPLVYGKIDNTRFRGV